MQPQISAILETFTQLSPPLSPHDLRHSVKVMKENGNLVSATLLFVLERMFQDQESKDTACLVGLGPGLEIGFVSIERVL